MKTLDFCFIIIFYATQIKCIYWMNETTEIRCLNECKPLMNLDELLNWCDLDNMLNLNSFTITHLRKHSVNPTRKCKTLLCHDMKGGYLDDRFNNGCDNELAYRFFHWSNIDVFVYFSHQFITIPPIGWINASHRNGVPILGTLIIEKWEGVSDVCDQMLKDKETIEQVVSQLVNIAKFYHFDGWLLNFESAISTHLIENLLFFVTHLSNKMHDTIPDSIIIWYDSVTYPDGKLNWQNELNLLNKCFFDACDGIFLNYTWKRANLQNSYELSSKNNRNCDVFVGIDVFGRNCFGGGGMNTNLAVNEIISHNLSMAIFAPGWTHEVLGCQQFTFNEYLFWGSLRLDIHHCPSSFPIYTSFCQGFGKKLYKNGEIISGSSWHNLNKQQFQPSNHKACEIYTDDAFNGGGCLRMKQNSLNIIECHLNFKKCIYAITYKVSSNTELISNLYCVNNINHSICASFTNSNTNQFDGEFLTVKYIGDDERKQNCDVLTILNKYELTDAHNGWITDCFIINSKNDANLKLTAIELNFRKENENDTNNVLIGQLLLIDY